MPEMNKAGGLITVRFYGIIKSKVRKQQTKKAVGLFEYSGNNREQAQGLSG
jgi:hypothetical protein